MVELVDLTALALPTHPGTLGCVPLPDTMKEIEAIGAPIDADIEIRDAGAGRIQDGCVGRQLRRSGVGEVPQDREVDERVQVPQCQDRQMLEELVHLFYAGQQRGYDHHGARRLGNSCLKIETRKTAGGIQRAVRSWSQTAMATSLAGSASKGKIANRNPVRYVMSYAESLPAPAGKNRQFGQRANRGEVHDCRVGEEESHQSPAQLFGTVGDVGFQICFADLPNQVIADVGGFC